jgi:succinylglutamic semialdehyde dehydrogenase
MIVCSLLNRANESKPTNGEWKAHSPANHEFFLGTCQYRYSDIDLAMSGAKDFAIPESFSERLKLVERLRAKLIAKKETILKTARQELGRTDEDFLLEWEQIELFLEKVLADPSLNTKNTDPRGVTVLLGSYVWPIFYTTQFAVMNFLAGNPLIVKPAEKSTLTVIALIDVFRELADFKSVQVVVGDREVGRRVSIHENVATLLFQGSFEVGMRVRQDALSQPGKEVLLYLGAKNSAIVFADAEAPVVNIGKANARASIEATLLKDAFLGTGQHCRSTSVIFVEKSGLAEFTRQFHELSKTFKIGGPETSAFMGPLIDGSMLDRYLKFIGISEREGAEIIMRGKPFSTANPKGHFVTPSIALFENLTPDQLKKSVSLQTEILSPHVSIVGFADESELLALLSVITHGKLASIWTKDKARAERIAKQIAAGEVLINRSVYGEDPYQTVQSRKRSGNHALLGRGLLHQLVFQKTVQ